jgi:hypothetical protein
MTISELIDHFSTSVIIWTPDNEYASDDWWTAYRNKLRAYLDDLQGDREILESIMKKDWVTGLGPVHPAGSWEAVEHWVDKRINMLFVVNAYKYRHLYQLQTADYNPLWNVDGTTKTTFDWDMTRTGKDEVTRSGEDKNVKTGNQANAATGTDTQTNSTTTYDSSLDHKTDKSEFLNGRTDTLTFNSVTDTRTYTALKDSREYTNLKDKKGGTETVTRQGNIGVTSTTQLENEEMDWAERLRLIELICSDIAGAISYLW